MISKNLLFAATLLASLPSVGLYAQSAEISDTDDRTSRAATTAISDYNILELSWLSTKKGMNAGNGEKLTNKMDGFVIAYRHGVSLTDRFPLFLELGIHLEYEMGGVAFDNSDELPYYLEFNIMRTSISNIMRTSIDEHLFSAGIPVGLAYRIDLPRGFYVTPVFGFEVKVNMGRTTIRRFRGTPDSSNIFGNDVYSWEPTEFVTIDSLSDEGMGAFDYDAWNRFRASVYAGVRVGWQKINLGFSYVADMTELSPDVKVKGTKLSFGFAF